MSLIERAISSLGPEDRPIVPSDALHGDALRGDGHGHGAAPFGGVHHPFGDTEPMADTVMIVDDPDGADTIIDPSVAGVPRVGTWSVRTAPRELAPGGPMVHLDLARLKAMGYATPDVAHTKLGQSIRGLKRQLLANATGRGVAPVERGRLIMVTSARAGAGKSFVALNLALSIAAERDHAVLLVDADVTNPSILATLDVESGPGLTDALRGRPEAVTRRVLRTNLRRLALLPIGTRGDRAAELLGSAAMDRAMAALCMADRRLVIVFDAPPLLGTAEAQALAGLMGQAVVVVEAGVTPRADVDEALDLLEPVPMVGVVLNKAADRKG